MPRTFSIRRAVLAAGLALTAWQPLWSQTLPAIPALPTSNPAAPPVFMLPTIPPAPTPAAPAATAKPASATAPAAAAKPGNPPPPPAPAPAAPKIIDPNAPVALFPMATSPLATSPLATSPLATSPLTTQYDKTPAPTPGMAAPTTDAAATDGASCSGYSGWDWKQSKYRTQKFIWLVGYPFILPTGPGYYSLRDVCEDNYREGPPKSGYPRFFALGQGFNEVNFSYVDDPNYNPSWTERLHRIHVGDNWLLETGGEYRDRYDNENNSRLTGKVNDFDLSRIRVFGDAWYQDKFRVFVEFWDARSTHQSLNPLLSDTDHADILQAFIDVKTVMIGDEAVYTRLGRQQILLGSQRLISPSDWGFTLRTWDGVRAFRRSDKFDVDAFWLRPVVPSTDRFDSSDDKQNFAGVYTTYRFTPKQFLETYWLYLSDHDSAAQAKAQNVGPNTGYVPYDIHTLGFRYAGQGQSGFLWEMENLVQVGSHNGQSVSAGNFTNGVGWHFAEVPLNPTFWAYYDYATGSSKVGGDHTFNQLYPLGHYYLGQQDYVGRANIQDLNFHMWLYPAKWITFNTQYHVFWLADSQDALYNTAGVVERSSPSGKAGNFVGSELDITANFHVGPRTDILVTYCHFFAGSFIEKTGSSSDLNTLYLVFNFRW